jgi:hypothetical protein
MRCYRYATGKQRSLEQYASFFNTVTFMHTPPMKTIHDREIHETCPYAQKGVPIQTKCWGVMSPPCEATTNMNLSSKAPTSTRSGIEINHTVGL